MRLIDELAPKYPKIVKEFKEYMRTTHNIPDIEKYIKDVPNAMCIPHLVAFLEKNHKIEILDVLVYVNYNTDDRPVPLNILINKAVKVVFYLLEHGKQLNFTTF